MASKTHNPTKALIQFLNNFGNSPKRSPGPAGTSPGQGTYHGQETPNGNPGNMLNRTSFELNDADQYVGNNYATTITIAAAKYKRIQTLADEGSHIRTIASGVGNNGQQVRFNRYEIFELLTSTLPFQCLPFITVSENGEVITATDSDSDSIKTPIISAVGAQATSLFFGSFKRSTYRSGLGYTCEIKLNILKVASRYLDNFYSKEINESTPSYLELLIGVMVNGVANQTIGSSLNISYGLSLTRRKIPI